ncbi:MAG: HD domain-containing phosphohydrolase [Planctomycetota bacterium]
MADTSPVLVDDPTALRELFELATALPACQDLQQVADLAAEVALRLLPERGVLLQLWDDDTPGGLIEAYAGPEMSVHMHRQALRGREGRLGEIVVDGLRPLTTLDRSILHMIVKPTATAAQNILELRGHDRAQHMAVLALARLAECRDQETSHHVERVSELSVLVGEGMHTDGHQVALLTDSFLHDLGRAAPLHDIGKVGIPDSVLLKPGRLTPEEWEIMKTHAELGARTLDDLAGFSTATNFLRMGRDVAWCHHERWDGTGYPRGLSGELIPLAARIVAIADIYDALTHDRPYKRAWSHREAVDWIRELSGTHLDPDVVTSFMRRLPQVEAIRLRLADEPVRDSVLGASLR